MAIEATAIVHLRARAGEVVEAERHLTSLRDEITVLAARTQARLSESLHVQVSEDGMIAITRASRPVFYMTAEEGAHLAGWLTMHVGNTKYEA